MNMSNNELGRHLCWATAEIEVPKCFWIAKLGQDGPENTDGTDNTDGPFQVSGIYDFRNLSWPLI
jgi:hypothetical protein